MSTHNINIKFNSNISSLKSAEKELTKINQQVAKAENDFKLGNISKQQLEALKKQSELLARAITRFKTGSEQAFTSYNRLANEATLKQIKLNAAHRETLEQIRRQEHAMQVLNKHEDRRLSVANRTKKALGQSFLEAPLYSASFAAMAAIGNAFQSAIEIDKTMTRIGIVTGRSAESMKHFAEYANIAAKSLGVTGKAYADASLIFLQQGGQAADFAQGLAESSIKLANITGKSSSDTSEYITAIANSFKLLDTQGANAGSNIADMLSALDAASGSSADEIASAFQRSASSFSSAGFSAQEAAAMIATVSEVTRQSSEMVGTGFKTMIGNLADVKAGSSEAEAITSKLTKVGKEFGMQLSIINEETGNMKTVPEILAMVTEAYNKAQTQQQKNALVEAVAGKEQRDRFIALITNQKRYNELLSVAQNSSGAADKAQARYMESAQAKIERVKNEWEELILTTIQTDGFKKLLDVTSNILENFNGMTDGAHGFLRVITSIASVATPLLAKKIFTSDSMVRRLTINEGKFFGKKDDSTKFKNIGSLSQAGQEEVESILKNIAARKNLIATMEKENQISTTTGKQKSNNKKMIEAETAEINKLTSSLDIYQKSADKVARVQKISMMAATGASSAMQLLNVTTQDSLPAADKLVHSLSALAPLIGSAFGPEGTAIGMAASGIIEIGFSIYKTFDKSAAAASKFNDELKKMKETSAESLLTKGAEIQDLISQVLGNADKSSKEYIDAANKLAALLPGLSTGTDEYGNAILVSNDALKAQIELLKQKIKLDKIDGQESLDNEIKAGNKKAKKAKKDINKLDKFINQGKVKKGNFFEEMLAKSGIYISSDSELGQARDVIIKKENKGFWARQFASMSASNDPQGTIKKANKYIKNLQSTKNRIGIDGQLAQNLTNQKTQQWLSNQIEALNMSESDTINYRAGLNALAGQGKINLTKLSGQSAKTREKALTKTYNFGTGKDLTLGQVGEQIQKANPTFTKEIKNVKWASSSLSDVKKQMMTALGFNAKQLKGYGFLDQINDNLTQGLNKLTGTVRKQRVAELIASEMSKIGNSTTATNYTGLIANAKNSTAAMQKYAEIVMGAAAITNVIEGYVKNDGRIDKAEYESIRQMAKSNPYWALKFKSLKGLEKAVKKGKTFLREEKGGANIAADLTAAGNTAIYTGSNGNGSGDKKTADDYIKELLDKYARSRAKIEGIVADTQAALDESNPSQQDWIKKEESSIAAQRSLENQVKTERAALVVLASKNKLVRDSAAYQEKLNDLDKQAADIQKKIIEDSKKLGIDKFYKTIYGTANIDGLKELYNFRTDLLDNIIDAHEQIIEKSILEANIQDEINNSTNESYKSSLRLLQSKIQTANLNKTSLASLKTELDLMKKISEQTNGSMKLTRMSNGQFRYVSQASTSNKSELISSAKSFEEQSTKAYQENSQRMVSLTEKKADLEAKIKATKDPAEKKALQKQLDDVNTAIKEGRGNLTTSKNDVKKSKILASLLASGQNNIAMKLMSDSISSDDAMKFLSPESRKSTQDSITAALTTGVDPLIFSQDKLREAVDNLTNAIKNPPKASTPAKKETTTTKTNNSGGGGNPGPDTKDGGGKTTTFYEDYKNRQNKNNGGKSNNNNNNNNNPIVNIPGITPKPADNRSAAEKLLHPNGPLNNNNNNNNGGPRVGGTPSPSIALLNDPKYSYEKYKVHGSETISQVAKKHYITPAGLMILNDLKPGDSIKGKTLYVPKIKKFQSNKWGPKGTYYADMPRKYRIASGIAQAHFDAKLHPHWQKFDTGGYTGEFKGGMPAILHEKELVLNKIDTANMLKAVQIVREIPQLTRAIPNMTGANSRSNNQNISINASFPNVSSSEEIKKAFESMSTKALQYAYRTKSY